MYEKYIWCNKKSHIRTILAKDSTQVLVLLMFYETRNNPENFSKF